MLALKLLLVPAFLALLTLAGRLFGPGIAGWLAGLPLVAGPILLVLALENGGDFAAQAATATVAAVLALVSYSLAYAHVAQHASWHVALAAGFAAWAAVANALAWASPSLSVAVLLALAALLVAPRLFPRTRPEGSGRFSLAELLLRMTAGALLTLAVAAAAAHIGGTWSGLFALFPVLGSVLAVFSHRNSGAGYAATLLQGMSRGLLSLVAFSATAAWLLPSRPLAVAFGAAIVACLTAQLATMRRAS
jgi:hypothetical protein